MSQTNPTPSRKDVLYAFAVEETPDQALLQEYQRLYPKFADDLLTLFHELSAEEAEEALSESAEDQALVDAAWRRHVAAGPVADPFAALSITQLRELTKALEIKMQVITAFQEHKILLATVPRRFMRRLAQGMNTTLEQLTAALTAPGPKVARSYKSTSKPVEEDAVSFAQALEDADIPADKIAELLAEDV